MEHPHDHLSESAPQATLGQRGRIALGGFAVVAAYFLWTEHRAHVLQFLPWAFLALCPLMHLFMHGGHGARGHRNDGANSTSGGGTR